MSDLSDKQLNSHPLEGETYSNLELMLDKLQDEYGLKLRDWVNPDRPGFELNSQVPTSFVKLSKGKIEFGVHKNKVVMDSIHAIYPDNIRADNFVYSIKSDGQMSATELKKLKFSPNTTYALIFPKLESDGERSVMALVRKDVGYTKINY
ncbi:MAG: hypothetical protein GOU98_00520 [Candidatus Altiarchaeota archaeon]|nr:hypothetical protein [Candidatus Altiarchaeota archaeon]